MKKYKPSDLIQRLLHRVFERDYSIKGILSDYFGIYENRFTGKWGRWDSKKSRFVNC